MPWSLGTVLGLTTSSQVLMLLSEVSGFMSRYSRVGLYSISCLFI